MRVDPRIPDEHLDDLYDAEYYQGKGFDRTIDYSAPTTDKTRAENADIIDSVAHSRGGSVNGARWLDVGCGSGALLEQLRDRGALAYGIDSSPVASELCLRKGYALLSSTEVADLSGSFDVVSAIEVIEHVPDPNAFLAFLTSCVRIGGLVFVGTGNWNLVRRLPGTPYLMPEGHIQFFTPDGMRRLFAAASLREARVFNRTWFGWRILPRAARSVIPVGCFNALSAVTRRYMPGMAPFPIGVRVGETAASVRK